MLLDKQFKIDANYSISIATSIFTFKNTWESFCPKNTYLSFSYLKAIENSKIPNVNCFYVVVFKNELPVGVLYYQWIRLSADFFLQKKFPKEIKSKNRLWLLKQLKGNVLLNGNFFATGVNGFEFIEPSLEVLVPVISNQLIQALKKTSFKVNFLMYKEFWGDKKQAVQNEISKTAKQFQIDVNMVLSIDSSWNNFEDYLAAMTTKYRTRAKSVFKKTSALVVKDFTTKDIKESKEQIQHLFSAVLKTANFNMVQPNVNTFYALKESLGANYLFKAYFLEDKLIAFSAGCINNKCLDANYVGVDYTVNSQIPLYQRMLYDYVIFAIAHKVSELRLGRTAEIMKSTLGAEPVSMNLYAKHSVGMLHNILAPLLNYVKPSEYSTRRPFKK